MINNIAGSKSIYGGEFEDESLEIEHNEPGIIGMVKRNGVSHTNESQFYITLSTLSSFNKKFVAFGRVVQGFDIIREIEEVETYLQRPKDKITIENCGEFVVK